MSSHASRCGRAFQHQIVSPRDSLWISDEALAVAFERYCRVSKTQRRYAGNLPGPLECRRRLGRRHMGELSGFQSSSSPPPWAFYAPLDLSQWRWEPPRSPEARRRQKENNVKTKAVELSAVLPRWLGELVADIPDERPSTLPDPDPPIPVVQPFGTDLSSFRGSVARSPLSVLMSDTENLCRDLQQSILNGEHDRRTYKALFVEIMKALDSRFGAEKSTSADPLYICVYSALIDGLASSEVFQPYMLSNAFWNRVLARAALLPLEDLYRLYSKVVDRFPRGTAMNRWTLCILDRFLSSRTSPKTMVNPPEIFNLEELLRHAVALFSASSLGIKELAEPELCSLIFAHWASRGYLNSAEKVWQTYEAHCSGRGDTAISSLALALFEELSDTLGSTYQRRGLYISLWRILESLGRSYDMIKSLKALSHTTLLTRGFLFALCSPCNNHRIVLRLASLYMHDLRGSDNLGWNPALFKRHAEKIISDEALPSAVIWPALGIHWPGQRLSNRRRHLGRYGSSRTAIAKKLAIALAGARHLRPRVAFRHMSRCVRFIELTTRRLPLPVFEALYSVVTRSTSREHIGEAARQEWFIALVRRQYGDEAADECSRTLSEWREGMQRVWAHRVRARYK
ncbi:hypothetical protein B0T16DRAFT_54303 [Cercophora newfieldiana]|uniref:Uncharacterized protein n=1 Tax=Cercophora newfieldiana TaxID=92897 RepID=A0AA39YR84_9PEZI|nr:hypothetical protein B0T16DRAFT_54303 [Cercophora newfieldiana]